MKKNTIIEDLLSLSNLSFFNRKICNSLLMLIVLFIFLGINYWLISYEHFFVFDDASHLLIVKHRNLIDFLSILPSQIYNDRPLGQLYIKVIQIFADKNWQIYHLSLLVLHVMNCVLINLLSNEVVKSIKTLRSSAKFISLGTAVLFALWPTSSIAYWWLSAIFDLLGTFFGLLFSIYLFKLHKRNQHVFFSYFFSLCLLLISLRTKEMFLTLPFIITVIMLLIHGKKINKKWLITSAACSSLSIIYFLILRMAKSSGSVTSQESPYYLDFSYHTIIINIFKYFILLTDFQSSEFIFTNNAPDLLILFPLFTLIVINFLKKNYHLLYIFAVCIFLFVLSISVTLPMLNMQHRLYLYYPNMFFIFGIMILIHGVINNIRSKALRILLIFSLSCYVIYIGYKEQSGYEKRKKYWLQCAEQDKASLDSASRIIQKNNHQKNLNIVKNAAGYTILDYGPGNLIKFFMDDKDLSFFEVKNSQEACRDNPAFYLRMNSKYIISHEECEGKETFR
jgi:hypothetical protein